MTNYEFTWNPKFRVNLSEAPTNSWREAYHWLDDETIHHEVVVKINEDLDKIGYVVEAEI